MVKERVKELGGQHFTAYDNNGNAVDVQIAESNARFVNKIGKSVPVNRDLTTKYRNSKIKQEAVVLADELIATARYGEDRAAKYPHGWLDDNGKNDWGEWKTCIQDKENTVWDATLHVSTSTNGEKILYDIYPIKKTGQSGNSDTSMVKPIVAKRTLPVKKRFSISEPVEQTETLLSTHNTYRAGDDASHLKAANSLDGDKYSFEALVSKSPVEIVPVAVRDIPTKGKNSEQEKLQMMHERMLAHYTTLKREFRNIYILKT